MCTQDQRDGKYGKKTKPEDWKKIKFTSYNGILSILSIKNTMMIKIDKIDILKKCDRIRTEEIYF